MRFEDVDITLRLIKGVNADYASIFAMLYFNMLLPLSLSASVWLSLRLNTTIILHVSSSISLHLRPMPPYPIYFSSSLSSSLINYLYPVIQVMKIVYHAWAFPPQGTHCALDLGTHFSRYGHNSTSTSSRTSSWILISTSSHEMYGRYDE